MARANPKADIIFLVYSESCNLTTTTLQARNKDLISRATAEANLQQLSDNPEEQNATISSSNSAQEPTAPAASKRSVLIRIAVALFRGVTALARRYSAAKQALRARMDDFRLHYMQPLHSELLPPWRRRPYIIVHHDTFVNIMTAMILVNTAALGMDHYGISSQWAHAINTINNGATGCGVGHIPGLNTGTGGEGLGGDFHFELRCVWLHV